MRSRSQFRFDGLSAVIVAIAIAIGFCIVRDETRPAIARWIFFPLSLPLPVVLLLIPACWFGNKLARSLLDRLPPNRLDDAEPIRFDGPRAVDDDASDK